MTQTRSWVWPFLLFIAGLLLFPSSGRDDVHISYWAAYALNEFGAIVNYNGEAVEQSSSLLHVLILAMLSRLSGLDVVDIGTPLSLLFGMLTVQQAGRLAHVAGVQRGHLVMAMTATATPLVYWSFGALETTLVSFLLTGFLCALLQWQKADPGEQRRYQMVVVLLSAGGYVLTRPEGILVLSAFLLAVIVLQAICRQPLRKLIACLLAVITIFLLVASWRWYSYGLLFPQPVYAKTGAGLMGQLVQGGRYYLFAIHHYPALALLLLAMVPAGLMLLAKRRFPVETVFPLLLGGSVLGFTLTSGGDWMEGARFFVPAIPLLVVVLVKQLEEVFANFSPLNLLVSVLALNLVQLLYFNERYSTSMPIWQVQEYRQHAQGQGLVGERYSWFELANRVHLRDAIFLDRMESVLEKQFADRQTLILMSSQGGMVPFHLFRRYYGRLRLIDSAGLASRDFSRCKQLSESPVKRSSGGIGVTHRYYLANAQALAKECGIPLPDLVYDIDDREQSRSALFAAHDLFRLSYQQVDDICPEHMTCPQSIQGNMFLAERVIRP